MNLLCFHVLLIIGYVYGMRCTVDFIANHMKLKSDDVIKTHEICEECMEKHNVTVAELRSVEKKRTTNVRQEVKCYFACYSKTYGTMDVEGNFIPGPVKTKLSERNLAAAMDCIPEAMKLPDHCERAYHLYKCYISKKIDSFRNIDDL